MLTIVVQNTDAAFMAIFLHNTCYPHNICFGL